jgi:hypothetical protein
VSDPVSVWQGELTMSGVTLHVHVLDDGTRIIEAADLHALMQAWEQGAPLDEAEAEAFARWQREEPPAVPEAQDRAFREMVALTEELGLYEDEESPGVDRIRARAEAEQ